MLCLELVYIAELVKHDNSLLDAYPCHLEYYMFPYNDTLVSFVALYSADFRSTFCWRATLSSHLNTGSSCISSVRFAH